MSIEEGVLDGDCRRGFDGAEGGNETRLWPCVCISGEDPHSISTGVYISSCPRLGGLGRPPRPYKLGARVHLIYPLATLFFFLIDRKGW